MQYVHEWGTNLSQYKIGIAACTNILVHVIPIEILQFFGGEVNARDFVLHVLWRLEAITVINVDWWVWVTWFEAGNCDDRVEEDYFMENTTD